MASRSHSSYVKAFRNIVTFFSTLGKKPFYQRLDNESSTALESFFKAEKHQSSIARLGSIGPTALSAASKLLKIILFPHSPPLILRSL
jgi:hypothetical protein